MSTAFLLWKRRKNNLGIPIMFLYFNSTKIKNETWHPPSMLGLDNTCRSTCSSDSIRRGLHSTMSYFNFNSCFDSFTCWRPRPATSPAVSCRSGRRSQCIARISCLPSSYWSGSGIQDTCLVSNAYSAPKQVFRKICVPRWDTGRKEHSRAWKRGGGGG